MIWAVCWSTTPVTNRRVAQYVLYRAFQRRVWNKLSILCHFEILFSMEMCI